MQRDSGMAPEGVQQGADEAREDRGLRSLQRPGPGKVTRTSKLPGRASAVQRKADALTPAGPAVQRRSLWEHTMDPWMDAAHRGASALSPGGDGAVQARGDVTANDPAAVHDAAAAGMSGGGSPLPHLDRIQPAFGAAHDVSGVRAHMDGAARDASERIGAQAYATGDHIAFRGQPDLHTAAHEAAHVVQQRRGVSLAGNVGQAGDSYERHADQVADAVVAGRSAEALLGGSSSGHAPATPGPVQRQQAQAAEVDVDALAREIHGTDDEDVILAALDRLRRPQDYNRLLRAWNLVAPRQSLPEYLQRTLGTDGFRQAMERITGVGVADSYGQVTGVTSESYYNLRSAPGSASTVMGRLDGQSRNVRVVGKSASGSELWYLLELPDQAAYDALVRLPQGAPAQAVTLASQRRAWVTASGVAPVMSWDMFIAQVNNFEMMHYHLDLAQRITMLRQMAHPANLPFDTVIGTASGSYYENDRPDLPRFFQMLRDAKAVRTPAGEIVDMYHFIVGLDAYRTGRRDQSRTMYGRAVGKSDSASTWAGDIGAGVADAVLRNDSAWEGANPGVAEDPRLAHYYRTRAPDADLLGDIDAWGVIDEVEDPNNVSLTAILNGYYGAAATRPQQFQNRRKSAIQRFMAQYRLTASGGSLISGSNTTALTGHIRPFAEIWYRNRVTGLTNPFPSVPTADFDRVTADMTTRFLRWLDALGRSVGAF
jgi:Domain of unknown function (DUF4157)